MNLFGFMTIPDWVAIVAIILISLYMYYTWPFGTFESMGVPYPKPWPILGTLFEEMTQVVPELDLYYYKKYQRLYGTFDSRTPNLKVGDPEFLKDVLIKEFSHFTDRREFEMSAVDPIFTQFLTVLKGEKWKLTRNVMTPTFTSGKLKLMVPLINKCCIDLIDTLREHADKKQDVEMKKTLTSYLLDTTASCVFGMEINAQKDEHNTFARHVKSFTDLQKRFFFLFLLFILPKFILKRIRLPLMDEEALKFFKGMINKMMEIKKSNPETRTDFLQLMLDAVKDTTNGPQRTSYDTLAENQVVNHNHHNHVQGLALEEQLDPIPERVPAPTPVTNQDDDTKSAVKQVLTEEGIVAQSVLFLFAGFETLATTLTFTIYSLATNPECQEKLIREIDDVLAKNEDKVTYESTSQMHYLEMVIYETMRLYPPAPRIDRQCVKTCVVKDKVIPKGMVITVPIYAIHRDEEFYPEPEKFKPERFSAENKAKINPMTYLAFGIGPRNCIGMRFALMEMKVTLANILREFQFEPGAETEIPLVFTKGILGLLPKKNISIKLVKRHK